MASHRRLSHRGVGRSAFPFAALRLEEEQIFPSQLQFEAEFASEADCLRHQDAHAVADLVPHHRPAHGTESGLFGGDDLSPVWAALRDHQGGVSHKHLQRYLDEFVFRFNRRRAPPWLAFQRVLERYAQRPPTYDDPWRRSGRHERGARPHRAQDPVPKLQNLNLNLNANRGAYPNSSSCLTSTGHSPFSARRAMSASPTTMICAPSRAGDSSAATSRACSAFTAAMRLRYVLK